MLLRDMVVVACGVHRLIIHMSIAVTAKCCAVMELSSVSAEGNLELFLLRTFLWRLHKVQVKGQ